VESSGFNEVGKWIAETRNAFAGYKKRFGHEPP
jgi:hypothetical protein